MGWVHSRQNGPGVRKGNRQERGGPNGQVCRMGMGLMHGGPMGPGARNRNGLEPGGLNGPGVWNRKGRGAWRAELASRAEWEWTGEAK